MNILIIGMGSNCQAEKQLSECRKALRNIFPDIRFSTPCTTLPIGFKSNPAPFINQLAVVTTTETYEQVRCLLKELERKAGRQKEDKEKEIVRLDLDVLRFNKTDLKAEELQRPYYQAALQELGLA